MKTSALSAIVLTFAVITLSACTPKTSGTVGNTQDIDSATNSEYSITQAEGETLGACSITSKASVEEALGKSVKEPNTTGVLNISGSKSETCIYAFDDVGVTNSFYVGVEQFPSSESLAETKEYSGLSSKKAISGLGDEAYFSSSDTLLGDTEHVAYVYKGLNKYTFAISHDQADTAFTSATAESALMKIMQSAALK